MFVSMQPFFGTPYSPASQHALRSIDDNTKLERHNSIVLTVITRRYEDGHHLTIGGSMQPRNIALLLAYTETYHCGFILIRCTRVTESHFSLHKRFGVLVVRLLNDYEGNGGASDYIEL